jgi:hypothetical protein
VGFAAASRLKLVGSREGAVLHTQPSSRIGENPPYGMIGRVEETTASSKPGLAPRSYPTAGGGARGNSRPYHEECHLPQCGSLLLAHSGGSRQCSRMPAMEGRPDGRQTRSAPPFLTRVGHCPRSGMLAVGETPPRSANPATLFGNRLIAIEARDLIPASPGKGLGQRALGHLVAASGTGKDCNRRNPVR